MTKQAYISTQILKAVSEGKSTKEAVDSVLGAGTFDSIASSVWERFNSKT